MEGETAYMEFSASSTSTGTGFTGCCEVVNTVFSNPRIILENYNFEDLNFPTYDPYDNLYECGDCSDDHPEIPCPPLASLTPTPTPTQTPTVTPTTSIACCPPTILSFQILSLPTYSVTYNATGSCGTCAGVTVQTDTNPFFTSIDTIYGASCTTGVRSFTNTTTPPIFIRLIKNCINPNTISSPSNIACYIPPGNTFYRIIRWSRCNGSGPNYWYVLHRGSIRLTTPTGIYEGLKGGDYNNPTVVTTAVIDEIKTSIYWNPSGICTL
jgi:hypothetical protein